MTFYQPGEGHHTSWKIADTRNAIKTATICIRNQGAFKTIEEMQANGNVIHIDYLQPGGSI